MDWAKLLLYSAPVTIAALGECVNQKAGALNIGLEGTMLVAAYSAMTVCGSTGSPYLGLGAGLLTALVATLLQSWFTIKLAADQVVVGTALNLLALGMTGTLFRYRFGASGSLLSVPRIPQWHGIDVITVLMVLLPILIWWLLWKTKFGLALRSAGEYPQATEAAGFSVVKLRLMAALLGGVLAGIAGAYLSLGVTGSFTENMTAGRGFVAIAMVTFGRWNPFWILGGSVLVGYAESLQYLFQAKGWSIPYQLLVAMPYVLALVVLTIAGKGRAAPQALGQPFEGSR